MVQTGIAGEDHMLQVSSSPTKPHHLQLETQEKQDRLTLKANASRTKGNTKYKKIRQFAQLLNIYRIFNHSSNSLILQHTLRGKKRKEKKSQSLYY